MLSASDVVAGLAVLLPLLASAVVAGHVAVRRLAPALDGAPYGLGVLVTATAVLLTAVIVPGAAGLLHPVPVLVAALLVLLGVAWRAPAASRQVPRLLPTGAHRPQAAWVLPATAVVVIAVCALGRLWAVTGAPILGIDALNFNLTIPADWIGQRSVWGLHQFIPDYSNATYPHHGNALLAAVMLPFSSTMLAQVVAVPYWAGAAVAAGAVARELGAPQPAAVLAGTTFVTLPVALRSGLEGGQTDLPMLACFGVGVLFLLRHARSGDRGELALAGLGLGIALGTKWYALTSVAVVVGLWLLSRGRLGRRVARDTALLVAVVLAAGGFWFLRNWVETGNPFFPQSLPPLFAGPEDDPIRDAGGWTIAHYLFDGDIWRDYLWPAFRTSFGAGGVVLAASTAVVAAAAAAARDRRVLLVLVATLALLAAYVVTPYSAFGPEGRPVLAAASTRYGLPALMGAAVLAAWLAGRGAVPRVLVQAGLAVAVADGLRRFFDPAPDEVVVGAVLSAVLAVAATRARPPLLAAGAIVAVVAGAVVAADRANTQGYAPFDPAFAFIEAHADEDRRIGVAGTWTLDGVPAPLPAFGRRLRNDVDYVGRFREHLLRRHESRRDFLRAARGFDLLLAGTGIPAGSDTREVDWAKAGGWRVVTSSARLVLLTR